MKIRGVFILIILFSTVYFYSCKHEPEETTALITVVDLDGDPVEGAKVAFFLNSTRVTKPTTEALPDTLISNASGRVEKKFKNGIVVDILAIKITASDTLNGLGYILLEPGETEEKKITMKKCVGSACKF